MKEPAHWQARYDKAVRHQRRHYEPDGSLVSRKEAGLLLSVEEAAAQAALLTSDSTRPAAFASGRQPQITST